MRSLLCALTLLVATPTLAQQTRPAYPPSPEESMPQGQMHPDQRVPPDLEAPQDRTMTPESQMNAADSTQVQQQIEQGLQSQTDLSSFRIDVKVDDASVTLTGTVSNGNQHQKVLAIASAHAVGRSIVDHIRSNSKHEIQQSRSNNLLWDARSKISKSFPSRSTKACAVSTAHEKSGDPSRFV